MKILYVEDSTVDADLARRALAASAPEIELHGATGVATAIAALAEPAAGFDLVISDLGLPDGSGLEVLAHVRRHGLPIAVVILTGSGEQESVVAALKGGADDYLVKRADYLQQLPGVLRRALERHRASRVRRTRGLPVLYVEHNRADVDLTLRHLAQRAPHIRLDVVGSADEALARLPADASTPADYGVLLVDYKLPGKNALELVKILRDERGLDLPVVLVTGQGSEELAASALQLGVDDYLTKHEGYLHELPATLDNACRQAELMRERTTLAATTERLGHLLATSPAILYAIRQGGTGFQSVWVSDNIERLTGYTVAEAMAPGWWLQGLHDDDRETVLARLAALMAQGETSQEYRFRHKDGRYLWIRDELRPARSAGGRVLEWVGAWHDVSAQRAADDRQRLDAAAFESMSDGMVITDLDSRILAVNRGFTEITGYTEAEAVQQKISLVKSDRQGPEFYQAMWTSIGQSGKWQGEIWNRRKGGEIYPQWLSISTVPDSVGRPAYYVGVFTDLSQIRHSEQQREHLAHYDPLTDLPNRLLLQSRLEHALDGAARHHSRLGVLVVDLDQFKTVNDSLGHVAGDELLVQVARRLHGRLRQEDTLGRLGGDEFLVLLPDLAEPGDVAVVARDLLDALAAPFPLAAGLETFISASIGVCVFPEDGTSAADLLRNADTALFRAKDQGRNRFCFYTGAFGAEVADKLEMEAALRRALERDELVLHYQPKVDLRSGQLCGCEALLRWRRGSAMVAPDAFIPLAERTGLIVPIGSWVIDAACRQLRAWRDAGLEDLHVAVNVSARQFMSGDLDAIVAEALARHGVPAKQLEIELTESCLMEDPQAAMLTLGRLRQLDLRVSLDDFGTGYSSLGYLTRFPITTLKIDRSFITDIVTDPPAAMISNAIIGLAHRMGLNVIAEGIETEAQLSYLRMQGCDEMQGYYFSKPLPAEDFAELVRAGKCLPAVASEQAARTLLLVDDEPHILAALRRMLRRDGYQIVTAGSAREGLEILAMQPVQVILSDQRMPEMNGTEFLARVKSLYPNTTRIVLSGYTELESILRAVNDGAIYKFLTKPWDDEQLRQHIRDAFLYHEAVVKPRATADDGPP